MTLKHKFIIIIISLWKSTVGHVGLPIKYLDIKYHGMFTIFLFSIDVKNNLVLVDSAAHPLMIN